MADNIGININDTVSTAMERWLYRYKKNGVKTATFDRLIISFKMLIGYKLASVRLIDLCTSDIQDFINSLMNDGYSMSTIRKGYNLMTAFVKFVIGEGLAIRPVYLNVILPKAENVKCEVREVRAYDPDEQARLRAVISKSDSMAAKAILLMLETGIRVGEALALHWSDVLWQRRALRIHTTLVRGVSQKKCIVQSSPKSKSSVRTIPLSKTALDMLASMKRDGADGFIFTAADGTTPLGYNSCRKKALDLHLEAEVPFSGFHVLRHTFATNAFYKGCEIKILSKLLGHSSVTITYNTYIHLYGDALEEMRSIVG